MDERLAALDRRVAEAADAWLADSRDTGVYTRLVVAIEARRAYLHPPLEADRPDPDPPVPVPVALQPDEVLDELPSPDRLDQTLHGSNPQIVLDRLRGSSP